VGAGLRDLKGKVVFLNFWATWCPPCKAEMPSMEFRDFVKAHGLTFQIGLDPKLDALGPRDWDGAAAHAVVESLLK
jgi:hypothetical protein